MHKRLIFQNMTHATWVNLAVASLLAFYAAQIALDFAWRTTCGHIAVDYCDFWSAGQVANTRGYAGMYDLPTLERVERSVFPQGYDPALFIITPFPYLPVFVLPFQSLALIPPEVGYIIWSTINIIALIAYLRFFSVRMTGEAPPGRLMILLLASLPMFLNVFYGQVEVWLAICAGEFMRQWAKGSAVRAGLWLGGLLIKPQLLIVIGLTLLLARAVRALAGLAVSGAVLVGASFLMLGGQGSLAMARIWQAYASGLPSNGVEAMMNWRMLGLHVSHLFSPWIGWALVTIGMLTTVLLCLYVARHPFTPESPSFSIGILGMLAASITVAWHSHVHVALLLLPSLLLLRERNILPEGIFEIWVLLPAAFFIAALLPENLMKLNLVPDQTRQLIYWMRGVGEFGATLFLLGWSVARSRKQAGTH